MSQLRMYVPATYVCVHVCVRVCVHACVRACVCVWPALQKPAMFTLKLKSILLHKIMATLKKYLCTVSLLPNVSRWRGFFWSCDVTVRRMEPIEGTNWVAMSWNCCHCYVARHLLGLLTTFGDFSQLAKIFWATTCPSLPSPPSHPPTPSFYRPNISAHVHQKKPFQKPWNPAICHSQG